MVVYTDPSKLPNEFAAHVGKGVTVQEEDRLEETLRHLGSQGKG